MLILSEIGWPAAFFDRFFPVLGPTFGLGALGIFQCLIGATVLSHHVDDFTLVAAFFLFALGCLNMLLGLVFREKAKEKRSIMSWRAEAKGVLPSHRDMRPTFARPASASFMNSMFKGGNDHAQPEEFGQKGHGFGRQGEKAAGLKGASRLCFGGVRIAFPNSCRRFPDLEAPREPAALRAAPAPFR